MRLTPEEKKSIALIPRLDHTKEHSALAVLRFVSKITKKEPKRLQMDNWETWFPTEQSLYRKPTELPACGTVACMAGWINITTGHRESNAYEASSSALYHLGLISRHRKDFGESDLSPAARDIADMFISESNSSVHARLERIMKTHRKELLAAKARVRKFRIEEGV